MSVLFIPGLWIHSTAWDPWRELPGKGHSLVFDEGWREVAALGLTFVKEQS